MKKTAVFALSICLCLFIQGCQKKEGPAEKLGKEIDKSVDDAGSTLKDALSDTEKKLGKAAEDFKKSVDSFGSKIKKNTESSATEREDCDK